MRRRRVVLWNQNKVMGHIRIVIREEINLSNKKRRLKLKRV